MNLQRIAQEYGNKLNKKLGKVQEMTAIMDETKAKISGEIDEYFDNLIETLNNRRNQLKADYVKLEQTHRRMIIQSTHKLKTLKEDLVGATSEIDLGISDFGSLT